MSGEKVKWQLLQREGTCSFTLSQYGLIFIGCEECDIILQSPGVEKRHAVLSFNSEKQDFYIKDLNSMTGTYINDMRIPEQSYFKLNHNDEIRFGYVRAYFTLNKNKPDPPDTEEKQCEGTSAPTEPPDILEADSLEDLKEDSTNPQQQPTTANQEPQQKCEASNMQDKREDLTLSLVRSGHKISPLSSQVIINYSMAAQSPDRKSDDLSFKTNGSVDSSDSSAGTMTLTANQQGQQQQQQQQQQPAAMAFTIPFEGQTSSKTFTRKKPKLKEDRTRNHPGSDSERGTRFLRHMNKSSSDDHSSETEHYSKANGLDKKAPDKEHGDASGEVVSQAPISDTTSYLIQRMLDGSTPQAAKWTNKKSPETTPLPSRWAVKKTPDQDVSPQISSPSHAKWGSSKTPDADLPPLCSPSQAKWASRKTPEQASPPPPGKWASRKTPEQEFSSTRWASKKTPEQEPPPPSKWAILSSTCDSPSVPEPSTAKEKDGDDKSETGTYTVDTEQEDPVVEEARNKIDEVFGVPDKIPGSIFKQNDKVSPANASENDLRHTAIDFKQSKHPITTPPAEKSTFDFIPFNHIMTSSTPNLYSNTYRTRKEAFQHENHAQTPPPRPPPRANRTVASKPETRTRENGSQIMGRSLSNNETGDSMSDGSPQASKHVFYGVTPWRRKSWNISCSDLELDHGKVETSSVLSDLSTSTEPSSHSSHSSRSRSGDVGPQMRLNRAFALRRARLGFESDEPVRATPPGVQAVRPLPRGASVSQNNLSRQDGGRFSLRLPRSAVVKMNKQPVKPRENKNVVQPFQHQHTESRSYVTEVKKPLRRGETSLSSTSSGSAKQPLGKGQSLKSLSVSSSDSEPRRPPLHHSRSEGPVQKSASFSGGLYAVNKSKRTTGSVDAGKRQPMGSGANVKKRSSVGAIAAPTSANQAAAPKKTPIPRPCTGTAAKNKAQPVPVKKEVVATAAEVEALQTIGHGRSKKEVSALDSLVISAIQQLSAKLKGNACQLLERERQKYPESSDTRLMIEEILPQMMDKRPSDSTGEGNLTRDLSSILKNLKRVEQTLDVFAVLSEQQPPPPVLPASSLQAGSDQMRAKPAGKRGFFVVDV